jgi:ABC-2 type transport system permease protein
MRNIWTIGIREYKHYFSSPIAYAVAFVIMLIVGILFYVNLVSYANYGMAPGIQIVIGPLVTLLLFTTPAVTMNTMADEQKTGTLELLLTAPVRDYEIIVGKWFGGFLFILTILLASWIFPIILNQLVSPGIDQGELLASYLGLALMCAAFVAIGIAASSLFSNQIAAFFLTLGIIMALWMVSYPAQSMGAGGGEIVRYLDLGEHFYSTFYKGLIDLKDVIYYLSLTAVSLFLGSVSVESRRWR